MHSFRRYAWARSWAHGTALTKQSHCGMTPASVKYVYYRQGADANKQARPIQTHPTSTFNIDINTP